MDTSIRLYNTNKRSDLSPGDKQEGRTTIPLAAANENGHGALEEDIEEERTETELTPLSASSTTPEPEQVNIADFEDIFLRYQTPITNFIYHLIGNREQAYDLAQDVFVKAYKALLGGTVVQSGALSAWLYRIAANTTTDTLRRKRIISWLPLSLFNEDRGIGAGVVSDSGSSSAESFTNTGDEHLNEARSNSVSSLYERNGYDGGRFESRVADREIVERVFQQLPTKYAVCLWLYENDGLACAEIAQVLNISSSAVKMRLMRAREQFIRLYQKEVGED